MAPSILQQPVRAAIYARISTTNHGQDIGLQTRELLQFAEARGRKVVYSYEDTGISGAKDRRPALDKLMSDAHRRRFDVVVCWRFDRFARSASHLLRAMEFFRSLGIDFVSFTEQMDTSTPTGKMVFTVLGAVAELERSLIAERVRAGIRNARAKGKHPGRPRVVVDAQRIASLRTQGRSWRVGQMKSDCRGTPRNTNAMIRSRLKGTGLLHNYTDGKETIVEYRFDSA